MAKRKRKTSKKKQAKPKWPPAIGEQIRDPDTGEPIYIHVRNLRETGDGLFTSQQLERLTSKNPTEPGWPLSFPVKYAGEPEPERDLLDRLNRLEQKAKEHDNPIDQQEALLLIDGLRKVLEQDNIYAAAQLALNLGIVTLRMDMRDRAPDAKSGRDSAIGAEKGGKSRRLSDEEIEYRRREYPKELARVKEKHPHLTETAAQKKAAKKFGISGRTFRKYL